MEREWDEGDEEGEGEKLPEGFHVDEESCREDEEADKDKAEGVGALRRERWGLAALLQAFRSSLDLAPPGEVIHDPADQPRVTSRRTAALAAWGLHPDSLFPKCDVCDCAKTTRGDKPSRRGVWWVHAECADQYDAEEQEWAENEGREPANRWSDPPIEWKLNPCIVMPMVHRKRRKILSPDEIMEMKRAARGVTYVTDHDLAERHGVDTSTVWRAREKHGIRLTGRQLSLWDLLSDAA